MAEIMTDLGGWEGGRGFRHPKHYLNRSDCLPSGPPVPIAQKQWGCNLVARRAFCVGELKFGWCSSVCVSVCLSVCLCVTLRSQMIGSIGTLETVFGVLGLVYMRKSCKSMHLFQDRTDLLHHRRCICNHLDDSKSLHYFLCSNMFAEHTKGPSGHLALRVFSSKSLAKIIFVLISITKLSIASQ